MRTQGFSEEVAANQFGSRVLILPRREFGRNERRRVSAPYGRPDARRSESFAPGPERLEWIAVDCAVYQDVYCHLRPSSGDRPQGESAQQEVIVCQLTDGHAETAVGGGVVEPKPGCPTAMAAIGVDANG